MGCNQSRERSEPQVEVEQHVEPAPQPVETAAAVEPVATAPVADADAPPAAAPGDVVEQENVPQAIEEPAQPAMITETEQIQPQSEVPAMIAAADAPEIKETDAASVPAMAVQSEAVTIPTNDSPTQPTPKVPALPVARTQKPSQRIAKTPRSTKTPRGTTTPRKENSFQGKTPSKTPNGKRSFGEINTNGGSRKVAFEAVPPPMDNESRRKDRVKKSAGRHACNLREEMFLASVAAFERQLTHRGSLDSQLNSR